MIRILHNLYHTSNMSTLSHLVKSMTRDYTSIILLIQGLWQVRLLHNRSLCK